MHFVSPETLTGSQGPLAADVQMADPRADAPGTMGFIGRKENSLSKTNILTVTLNCITSEKFEHVSI